MTLSPQAIQAALASKGARVGMAVLALLMALLLGVWGADLVRRVSALAGKGGPSQKEQIVALQAEVARLQVEKRDLLLAADSAKAAAAKAAKEAEAKLAAATVLQEQQARQIKVLELEHSKLSAETTKAAPKAAPAKAAKAAKTLAVRRFEADLPAPRQLHYRLTLTQPLGSPKLSAQLQLLVTVKRRGRLEVLRYPAAGAAGSAQFVVKLGQVQRCEGLLALPDGVIVKTIQARVFEKGLLRTARTVTVKDAAHVRS